MTAESDNTGHREARMIPQLLRTTGYRAVEHAPHRALHWFLQALQTRPELAEAVGYQVYPRSYTSPLPLKEETDLAALQRKRFLPGIELNQQHALALVDRIAPYVGELASTPYERRDGEPFWFANSWFNDFDAATLYALLRHVAPKRYVELGCGFSSIMSSRALARNGQGGSPCDALYADPHPRLDVVDLLEGARFVRKRVQDLPLDVFTGLDAGDVLFVDTSHVVKTQSDVVHTLVTVLPMLTPGVWVHFHDVFTPYDYPVKWVTNPLFSNNEQYAVEALLTGGDRFIVELPLYFLWREHPADMERFFPRGKLQPQGLWIRQ